MYMYTYIHIYVYTRKNRDDRWYNRGREIIIRKGNEFQSFAKHTRSQRIAIARGCELLKTNAHRDKVFSLVVALCWNE